MVVVGSLGVPRQAKFHPTVPRLVAGDAEGVPPLQRIPQVEVMAEEFARVLAQAWGPPTLEWCQNKALCVLCAWRGKACIFDALSVGSWHDTSVCLPYHANHKKCSISLEWQVACIAAEQGWGEDWVQSQLGEAQRTQMSGEASLERSAGQMGPPRGGRREGASSVADHGKRRASTGEAGLRCGVGREGGIGAGVEHLGAGGAGASVGGTELAGASDAAGGAAHGGGEEWEMAPEAGLLWVELEVARRREDWLANKAASGRVGIL
ncbi:hypothetical protein C0989_008569, partial [Termitomyces sp. Mn162]